MKPNQAIEQTAKMNDSFCQLQRSQWEGEKYFYDKETALNYRLTTDFKTMAEAVHFDGIIFIRYNWQLNVTNKYNMLMVLNLN